MFLKQLSIFIGINFIPSLADLNNADCHSKSTIELFNELLLIKKKKYLH